MGDIFNVSFSIIRKKLLFYHYVSILLWLLGILQFLFQFTQWNKTWVCVCFTWSLIHVACDTNELAYRKKYNGLLAFPFILLILIPQLAKKIREKFNRYLDVVNRNKQVVEASYTAHLTAPLTAIQDCCTIPPSMME